MKQLKSSLYILLISLITVGAAGSQLAAAAAALTAAPTPATPNGLSLTQIKITGDEFIILQNNALTEIPDLSQYSLKSYSNVNRTAAGVSSAVQQLPATYLGAGQRLILSAATRNTCGAIIAGKLSLSLVDGGGFLEVLQTVNATPIISDSVSWSNVANGIIPSVPTNSKDPQGVYYRYANGSTFNWQLADQDVLNYCQLSVVTASNGGISKISVPTTSFIIAADSAPATIVTASTESASMSPSLPVADIGLIIPEITELLPNPLGSGNDARDEFIELYNPNDSPFDLGGFKLQTGVSSVHIFTFSTGVMLQPKSFTSFSAATTGLSLSNNGSRAQLLDPNSYALITTDTYGTALDGQSWALANGHWYWSLTPTPGAANVVTLPAPAIKSVAKSAVTSSITSSAVPKVKAPSKIKKTTTVSSKAVKTKATKAPKKPKTTTKTIAATPTAAAVAARPVQVKVVALVAGLAVLYGAYEYRADLANLVYKLRSKFGAGRPDRS